MSINLIIFLLKVFIIFTPVCNSIEPADKRCHKVPLLKNFDIQRIAGHWYAQDIGDLDGDESLKSCLLYSVTFDKRKSGTTMTGYRMFNWTRSVAKVEMYKAHQITNTSEFIVEWKAVEENRRGWVVGTDYDVWSTWYLCQPEQVDKGVIFIATRQRNPTNITLETARNSLRKVGFKMTKPYLKRIDQTQCFN